MLARGTRWFVGAMTLLCVVLVGSSAADDPHSDSGLPADPVRDVVANRVMTWNLCNPCEESNVHRAAEIAAFAPQVLGVQEACVRDVEAIREHLENLHGLVYHVEYGMVLNKRSRCGGAPWNPGGFGQAILSAAPMTDHVSVEYPEGGSEDRGYMAVTTEVGGQDVRVFNTHLAQRRQESVRAGQAAVLATEVARHDRAVVLGDLNAVPDAPELSRLWALAVDADPQCHPTRTAAGSCQATTDWQSKFDYVFLRGITPAGHRVHASRYSDHHQLYADLDLA
ncbi:putative endonuclease/exonuclease/phosphatase family protein [Streptomyces ambofaciens ATCC 23877]|uniref:Putative endonuclease/exonuclease/phosphatase family protein n=1 Tax=Streptomyces ambofaciens (strain ATCC 23877 / 3486 / DSM 40053 / JCM 4204 / NBRC 12836 / NRRL B-2516) TaxID=278992 RepID=A0A0K2AKE4_STRA7|nr:putative endonuclease/exonuclease/phosphatase family protein [Streptomyces ambofaciens ATCC 23877]